MKRLFISLSLLATFSLITSCATIVGGSKYNARVKVKDHPSARISYNGMDQGVGDAFIKLKRKDANKFTVSVKEEGCKEQRFDFTQRSFRGWAFVGTLITWTGYVSGIYIPWGVGVDFVTGALWKPNIHEPGVLKIDSKNYFYLVDYSGCKQ